MLNHDDVGVAPKLSEYLGLRSACETFPHFSSIWSSNESVESQFFVATCVVPSSEERKLERFFEKRILEIFRLPVLRGHQYHSRGF